MKSLKLLLAAILLVLCVMVPVTLVNAASKLPLEKEADLTYLVGLKKNININTKQLPFKLEGIGKIKQNYGHFPVVAIKMTPSKAKLLALNPNIKFIEQDGTVEISEAYPWNITRINANLAQKRDITGKGIKLAIFDTGVDAAHKDLSIAGGISLVDGCPNYNDDNGHGTKVAGIIDAQLNEKGMVGASPGAQLYPVKVLDKNGKGTYSQIISALDWAMSNNIKVVCMSFGGKQPSQALEQAMQTASDNGILLIAAAGNTAEIQYPAQYPSVMAIGAVDRNNKKADFSATGSGLVDAGKARGIQPDEETAVITDSYLINKINKDLGNNLETGRLTAIKYLTSDRENVRLHAAEVLSQYAKYDDLRVMYKIRENDKSEAVKQTIALSIAKTEWRTQQSHEGKLALLAIQLKSSYPSVRDFALNQLAQLTPQERQEVTGTTPENNAGKAQTR